MFIFIAFSYGCALRPYNNNNGYIVLPVSNSHYRIEYYSAYAKYVKKNWDEAARTLCSGDYSVIYKTRDEISYQRGYVPSGVSIDLGGQAFVQHGEVNCNGAIDPSVPLTKSIWRTYSEKADLTPVSETYLRKRFSLDANVLSSLPVHDASAALANAWGEPAQVSDEQGAKISVWYRDGKVFSHQIVLDERDHCLQRVTIYPGVATVMLASLESKSTPLSDIKEMIRSGRIPSYFYQHSECIGI